MSQEPPTSFLIKSTAQPKEQGLEQIRTRSYTGS